MKIICLRDTLISNINIVSRAVAQRSTLEILECILLFTENGHFKMVANDLKLGIQTNEIECEIIEEGSVAIDSKLLSEMIRKLPDGFVTIDTDNDNNVVNIKSNKSKFKISGKSGDDFPYLPIVERDNFVNISSIRFKDMVQQTIFSVSMDETKQILTGELIEINETKINMVAIDGFRVAFKSTEIENTNLGIKEIVVPSKALSEIIKIIGSEQDENISFFITDKHIMFECEKCFLVSRLLEGEYIKYSQLFTDEFNTKIFLMKDVLIHSLERALIVATNPKKDPVKFEIEGKVLKISSNTEYNTFYDELDIETEGNDLEIAFNPRYIIEALKAIEDEEITMQFTTALSPCTIFPKENIDCKYLVLPLRL